MAPREAVASGRIGAMLQTGSLIRDLSVRELIEMVASLYPQPLGVDEAIELTGIGEIADRRTQKLSGGETQRARFAVALVSNPDLLVLDEPTVAMDVEARRAFWATMREFASRRPDGALRDALPRGGGCIRRSRHPHGERAHRRRRAADRDQGDGRQASHPGDAARRRASPSWKRSRA